ncbi:MAG TPA: AAA family ATPase [Verrucomicrobiae bacterium]|jgi:capsular exopolysaccharide synthesis family protein|nr:AAA family ATPase [Verrucomicrobiae bacterium]
MLQSAMGGSLFSNSVTEKTIVLPSSSSGNGDHAQYRLTVMVPRRRYLSYIQERWWLVLIFLAVAIGGTIVYQTLRPESYNSYAELYITEGAQLSSSLFGAVKDDYATEIELLKGDHLRAAAMEDLGPDANRLKKPIGVEVVRPMGTTILQLRATGPDPMSTQRFLQALINEYLDFKRQSRLSTSDDVIKSLTQELSTHEANLKAAQDQWAVFQRTNNVALLEEQSKSVGTFLANENVELANLNLERELLKHGLSPENPVAVPKSTGTNQTGMALATETNSSPTVLSPTDTDLKSTQVSLMLAREELAEALTNGQAYKETPINNRISQLQQDLLALQAVDASQRKAQLEQTIERMAAISNAIPLWQAEVAESNNRLSEGDRLKANIQRQQGYYDSLLGLLQNVDLTKNMQQERVTVLDTPTPGQLVQGNLPVGIFLATVLALAASLSIIFVWHLFDDRFVSVRDIKDQFGEVVLGLVPRIKIPRSDPKAALLKDVDPRRPYWESFRHLRSALLLSDLGGTRPQTILFTAAMPGEGKTTVALNLARVLARSGLRVVLVDVDPHGSGLRQFMGETVRAGLLEHLHGDANLKDITRHSEIQGLDYIGAGMHREQIEGLLLRPQFGMFLEELRKNYDYIMLDSAPILAADDAALLVPHAQAVVLVVRPFSTRARRVRQALEMLYQRQAKNVAIILNQARPDDIAAQHFHYRNGSERPSKTMPLVSG